jgi:hypothetical protein
MKTPLTFKMLPVVIAALAAAPIARAGSKVLIDFGNNSTFRGATTPSPDTNGKYWNSIDPEPTLPTW